MEFDEMVRFAVENGASDIHLASNNLPSYRKNGKIMSYKGTEILDEDTVMKYIDEVLEPADYLKFCNTGDIDSAYQFENLARFRVNAFKQRHGATLVMRVIKMNPPKLGDLNLPQSIAKILNLQEGLVLVTGPTGSGKSTTLAALVDKINTEKAQHIITIEDPIEFTHKSKKSVVVQREVHYDTYSFSAALRSSLRQDPDVVLIGEMRDLETISAAITIAETGHLVFATLHTNSAAQSIDRMIDVFPPHQQPQIRAQLANILMGICSQRLVPSIGGGRVVAAEVLIANSAVRNVIREGKSHQLDAIIQTGADQGMQTMDRTLVNLVQSGTITYDHAREFAVDLTEFERLMRG